MTDEHGLAKAFLEQCPAVIWAVDRNGAFRRFYSDPSCVFGKSAAELHERTPDVVLDPAPGEQWKNRFARALAGETLMLRERRGNITWYVKLFPIRIDGRITHVGGVAQQSEPWSTADQELRHTVLSALRSQEFERKMASQFLHDSVGQNLTAFGLQLDLIRMDLESLSPETCARIAEMQKTLEGMMEEVREYSYELNPSTVERAGLRSALDRLASRLRHRFTGWLRIRVDPSLKLDPKIATALFHIAQEALENAVQHAGCSNIEIAVKCTRKGIVLEVKDDGRGFDPDDILGVRRGLGLLSMEHFAAQAGLQLTITSSRESGTLVRATLTRTRLKKDDAIRSRTGRRS
jgi:signal transduction histidine kinase